jgi:hypothetical protein
LHLIQSAELLNLRQATPHEDVVRLTRHTDNALRALIYLAIHDDAPARITDIARRMGMSEDQ